MKTPKAIDPKRIATFELGDAYCEDQISLIIPFKNLEYFHRIVSALIEKNKEPQPPDNTGHYITYRGTLHKFSNNASHHRQQKAERGTSGAFCSPSACVCYAKTLNIETQ